MTHSKLLVDERPITGLEAQAEEAPRAEDESGRLLSRRFPKWSAAIGAGSRRCARGRGGPPGGPHGASTRLLDGGEARVTTPSAPPPPDPGRFLPLWPVHPDRESLMYSGFQVQLRRQRKGHDVFVYLGELTG